MAENDFPVFTPTIVSEMHEEENGNGSVGDLIAAGNTIQQIRTSYMTAVGVQKKRDLADIVKKCELEAQYAGDSLWYGWKQGGKEISGSTIGLAMIVARNWGNCASEAFVVEDKPSHFMVSASFIDLESGSTITRPFKQNKNRKMSDKQRGSSEEVARQEDITLQIAVSKAMRNAVLAATPDWLHARMIEKARAAISDGLVGEKLKKAIAAILHQFQDKFGVTEEMLVTYVGKPSSSWVADQLLDLKGVYNALKEGRTKATEIFASADAQPGTPEESTPTAVEKAKAAHATAPKSDPAPTAAPTVTPGSKEEAPATKPFNRAEAVAELIQIAETVYGPVTKQKNQAAREWSDGLAESLADLTKAPDNIIEAALPNARQTLKSFE